MNTPPHKHPAPLDRKHDTVVCVCVDMSREKMDNAFLSVGERDGRLEPSTLTLGSCASSKEIRNDFLHKQDSDRLGSWS